MSSHPKWQLRLETQNGCLEQVFVLVSLCDGFPFNFVPKATLPDPGFQPSSDYLALAWFLRCFWEDEATGRVGAVILLLEGSNWWIADQWLWPSWNLAAILSFQDEEREKKEKEAEERRAKEAQKEAEERAKEAHQALLKHITIHTVLQSWCHLRHTNLLAAFQSPNRPFTGTTLSTHGVWDRLQHNSCGPAGTEIGRSKGQGRGVDVTPAGCCCGAGGTSCPYCNVWFIMFFFFFSAQTMCVLANDLTYPHHPKRLNLAASPDISGGDE